MNPIELGSAQTLLIIGLGRSGQASAEVLRARGVTVYAVDEKPARDLLPAIQHLEILGASFVAPEQLPAVLTSIDAAILSPGVPLNSALVRSVQAADIPVLSEIEIAYRLSRAPILAVTGTKGKSTTTSLIAHLLRAGGLSARVGGNIGNPLIAEVADGAFEQWVVAEVSSFQLEAIRSFHPRIAAILNISPDHLDRYHSMEEYAEAKYRIFANQNEHDFFVGALDDARLAQLHWLKGEGRIRARQLWYTIGEHDARAAMYMRGDTITYAPISGDPRPVPIMLREDIPLTGAHNLQNVMAALLAAIAAGVNFAALREGVASFSPMAHRLAAIAEIGGVLFVDDSKATNPAAAIAALRSFDRPIVLIAGGRSKNTDFVELGRVLDERVKLLIALGESAEELAAQVSRTRVERAASMEEAVRIARANARAGDVVLLSPACASFDMFDSAEHRGDRFANEVQALAEFAAP